MAIRVALERLACSQGRLLSHSAAACSGDPRQKAVEMGREEQARVNAQLKRVMPQVLKPPQRSAEQLADAEARSKEYSRLKMAQHKELQRSMRERKFLRCEPDAAATRGAPQC